jgi:alcohol dehydrogenase
MRALVYDDQHKFVRDYPLRSPHVNDVQADVVVDCTGKPAGFDAARAMVRPRGTIVLKSTFAS